MFRVLGVSSRPLVDFTTACISFLLLVLLLLLLGSPPLVDFNTANAFRFVPLLAVACCLFGVSGYYPPRVFSHPPSPVAWNRMDGKGGRCKEKLSHLLVVVHAHICVCKPSIVSYVQTNICFTLTSLFHTHKQKHTNTPNQTKRASIQILQHWTWQISHYICPHRVAGLHSAQLHTRVHLGVRAGPGGVLMCAPAQ